MTELERKAISAIRALSADMIEAAGSGHPGVALGAAPILYSVFTNMRHSPTKPGWLNRDRFVLSCGHGSAMLYSALHLFGYDISLDDLKAFRQLDSKTPGHPEYGHTAGVEVTTGPLGQGVANAVGMALAEAHLAARFNKQGLPIVDHYTFALCGDGCLMEGISAEAASLAGTLKLGKLIVIYDSNNVTIEGSTALTFTEDVMKRFEAYGWHVIRVNDGNDLDALGAAIGLAKALTDKPTFIEVKTVIGFGSPNKSGRSVCHGEPLGAVELKLTKQALGVSPDAFFDVGDDVYAYTAKLRSHWDAQSAEWEQIAHLYEQKYSKEWKQFMDFFNLAPLAAATSSEDANIWAGDGADAATRVTSGKVLNIAAKEAQNLFGGSADLAPSNKSVIEGGGWFTVDNRAGRNVHFGVREHAMSAIANGMAAHGGIRPFVAGFLVFSDYMKPAIRLAALMNLPVIYILTHDSIGVGEDGPTHQPIEQLDMLRGIPGLNVFRPADHRETAAAYIYAINSKRPSAIIATRQNLPQLEGSGRGALRGGYILVSEDIEKPLQAIIIATGSEVSPAVAALEELMEKGVNARVVSMPSIEVFEAQVLKYREDVLPKAVRARVAIEAGGGMALEKYVGLDGRVIRMEGFGASAPAGLLLERFGFTAANVVSAVSAVMEAL